MKILLVMIVATLTPGGSADVRVLERWQWHQDASFDDMLIDCRLMADQINAQRNLPEGVTARAFCIHAPKITEE